MSGHDYASQAEAQSGPGRDTRQWVSNGVVNLSSADAPSVTWGPLGPLVSVRLHPSDIDVQCRVASWIAGEGEGEWHPFVGGNEVVVLLPSGSERGGAIIVGRLSNGVDVAPTGAAGIDITQNQTSTRVTVPNYAWETKNGWILRNSATSAQLALTVGGDWILNCGELHFLSLSAGQGVVLSNAEMKSFIQISPTSAAGADAGDGGTAPDNPSKGGAIIINAGQGKAGFVIDPDSGMIFATTAASVPLAGPVGHVATVEGVVSLVSAALTAFGLLIPPPATVTPAQVIAAMLTAIPAAGKVPPYATFATEVAAAMAVPRSPDGVAQPGLGCAGFMV